MDKSKLLRFLIMARTKTYVGGSGKVKSAFPGGHQLEYRESDWVYRDFYNLGNAKFMGLETVYFQNMPVFSMSYFGNFQGMTEKEVDEILRQALLKHKEKTRLWHNVTWKKGEYTYSYLADGDSLEEFGGTEEIQKKGKRVYHFYSAGGLIG